MVYFLFLFLFSFIVLSTFITCFSVLGNSLKSWWLPSILHFLLCLLQNASTSPPRLSSALPLHPPPHLILDLSANSLEISLSGTQVELGAGGLPHMELFTYLCPFGKVLHSAVLGSPWLTAFLPLHRANPLFSLPPGLWKGSEVSCSSHFLPFPT